ncbi:hypothetical protein LTS18_011737, partial [Coniosporium uncinatum]
MIVPTAYDAIVSNTYTLLKEDVLISALSRGDSSSDKSNAGWSSLIGIITAIIGNILISFALNTQRYAHIRLDKQFHDKQNHRSSSSNDAEGGTQREDDGKAGPNAGRKTGTNGLGSRGYYGEEAGETQPLLQSQKDSDGNGDNDAAAAKERRPSQSGPKSYLKSPYWWTGIVLMTVGEAGNFLAYGFAPASIVSPLGVVALISNCIIAPIMLKEKFRKRDLVGVVVAIGGAVTVVLSASDSNPKLGPDEIWQLIATWEFETYFGITLALIIALMVLSNRYGDKSILIDLGLVGLFGGYTALSTKGVASLLTYTIVRALTFPVTYLLVAILIGTAVMQIKYVNRALQRFDATQVIPIQFVMFTLSVILGSAVLYRDFERTSGEDAGKFIAGCALTFSGVWLITSGRGRHDDDDEDISPEDDDTTIRLIDEEAYEDEAHDDVAEIPQSRRGSKYIDSWNSSRSRRNSSNHPDSTLSYPSTPGAYEPPQTPTISLTPHDASYKTTSSF